jgi:hypothetical protein
MLLLSSDVTEVVTETITSTEIDAEALNNLIYKLDVYSDYAFTFIVFVIFLFFLVVSYKVISGLFR